MCSTIAWWQQTPLGHAFEDVEPSMKFSLFHLLAAVTLCAILLALRHEIGEFISLKDIVVWVIGVAELLILLLLLFAVIQATRWAVVNGTLAFCFRNHLLKLLSLFAGARYLAHLLNLWGVKLFQNHAYEVASEVFSQAMAFDARVPMYRANRGTSYVMRGMFEKALIDLTEYHCETEKDSTIAYYRGLAREGLLDWAGAAEDLTLAARLNQDDAFIWTSLALLQAGCPLDQARDGHQAIENAQKACDLTHWKEWKPMSALAAAYAEVGDFDSAVRFASQALDLAPEEEKQTRSNRMQQYEKGIPYRYLEFEFER